MPTTISISVAQIARRMLRGAFSPRMSLTLRLLTNDSPRSQRSDAAPVVHELHEDRVVEAVAGVGPLDHAGVDGAVAATGEQRGRVAGEEEEEEEEEGDGEEDRRDQQQDAPDDVAGHALTSGVRSEVGGGRRSAPHPSRGCWTDQPASVTCSQVIRPKLVCGKLADLLLVVGVVAPVPVDRDGHRLIVQEDLLGLLEQGGLLVGIDGRLGLVDEGIELRVAEAVVVPTERVGVEQVVHEVVVRRVVGEPTGPAERRTARRPCR